MHIATPIAPPIHNVARPFLEFLFNISCISVTKTLVPDAPIGWPRAIAPPFTVTFSIGRDNYFTTAQL